jgi:hypothetical protein
MFWRPVTDGNCVAARRGGEQPEVNDQSVTQVNSIRPSVVVSLRVNGEAQVTHGLGRGGHATVWSGKPGQENPEIGPGQRGVVGDGMIGRFGDKTQRDLGGIKSVFMLNEPKSRPPRSQSTHRSWETG